MGLSARRKSISGMILSLLCLSFVNGWGGLLGNMSRKPRHLST